MVTLPNFWETIHAGDVTVVRDNPRRIAEGSLHLASGESLPTDAIVACTGWGDHFGMFDSSLKSEIGLPEIGVKQTGVPQDLSWESVDIDADKAVNTKLPFISIPPGLKNPGTNNVRQRQWRLYRRSIPLKLALENDRSLAILGQIHTVQTPLVSEMQSFWTILYLLGEIDLPAAAVMRKEIAEWNAWTRKRYLSQGQKFPYSLYDFLPVSLSNPIQNLSTSDLRFPLMANKGCSTWIRYVETWVSIPKESQTFCLKYSRRISQKTSMDS